MPPDILLWLLRMGALLSGLAGGWILGRGVPSWRGDSRNESFEGWGYDPELGTAALVLGFFRGSGLALPLILVAATLGFYGWPLEGGAQQDPLAYLFSPGSSLALGSAVAGYVAATVTDKGPVGPLG